MRQAAYLRIIPQQFGVTTRSCYCIAILYEHVGKVRAAMREILLVILCGVVGSRLWTLLRRSLPKQFASLIGDKSVSEVAVQFN